MYTRTVPYGTLNAFVDVDCFSGSLNSKIFRSFRYEDGRLLTGNESIEKLEKTGGSD